MEEEWRIERQCTMCRYPLQAFIEDAVEPGSLLHTDGFLSYDRLEKHGWLKAEWGVSEANQRAKYYRLTAAGKAQLSRERDRWSQLVDAIGRVMNPAPASEE